MHPSFVANPSCVRRWQAVGKAVGPHLPLLIGQYANFAARHGAAEQDETSRFVLRKIQVGMVVLYHALEQTPSAGNAASLSADKGKVYAVRRRSIEDVFIGAAIDGAATFGRFKDDAKAPLLDHIRFDAAAYGL